MFFKGKICIENMLKIAFVQMSFLHFFAVFYKKYSDFNVKKQWKTGHMEKL